MTSRRFILLWNDADPREREVLAAVKAAPDREGAALTRALLLIGHAYMNRSAQNAPLTQPTSGDSDDI